MKPRKLMSPFVSDPVPGYGGRMEFPVEGEDDQSVIIGRYDPPTQTVNFNPFTTIAERRVLCERVGLSAQKCRYGWKLHQNQVSETVLVKKVLGDGNCLFRALSYLLCGSEDGHVMLRQTICNTIMRAGPDSVIGRYVGENTMVYMQRTKMTEDAQWGTDIEIFTAAQLLKCDIYTYCLRRGLTREQDKLAWVRYAYTDQNALAQQCNAGLIGGVTFSDKPSPQALYLDNTTGVHYDAIIGFK